MGHSMGSHQNINWAAEEALVMANKYNMEIYVFELKGDVVIDGDTFEKGFRTATEKAWKESWSKHTVLKIVRPNVIVSCHNLF